MSAFHRWLLKHRSFCEICVGPYPSTRIIAIQGHNRAVCDAHFASHHPLRAGYERKVAIHYGSKIDEQTTFSRPAFSSQDDGDKRTMAATAGEGTAPKLGSGKCGGPTSATNSRVQDDVTAGETAQTIEKQTQI